MKTTVVAAPPPPENGGRRQLYQQIAQVLRRAGSLTQRKGSK